MVLPPRRPSAGMQSIRRELECRRAKPQAPKRPAAEKTSAPPPLPSSSRAGSPGKVLKACTLTDLENPSSGTSSMARSRSGSTHPPPPKRPRLQAPPRASIEVSPLPLLPSRYVRSSSTSVLGASVHLKPIRRAPPGASPALPLPIGSSSEARSTSVAEARTARHLKPLAPKRSAAKKPTAPPPPLPSSCREGAHGKVHKPCPPPVCENLSSITSSMVRSGSFGTIPPPPKRPRLQAPPRATSQVSPVPPPRSRYASSSVRPASAPILDGPSCTGPAPSAPPPPTGSSTALSTCAAAGLTAGHLKPGTRVTVRTRSLAVIDGKILVLWLPATVVSATDDSYEVIYDGNLPRDNPFSIVHVPLHHVRPIKPSQPTLLPPPSQSPSSAAASLSASASNAQSAASKSVEILPNTRPTTAGKSLRLIHGLAPEVQPPPRPTTAGKSLRLVSSISPVKQQASRPTTAGKSLRIVRDPAAETRPAPRPTTGGKSIRVIRRTLSEKDRHLLDASCSKLGFLVHD